MNLICCSIPQLQYSRLSMHKKNWEKQPCGHKTLDIKRMEQCNKIHFFDSEGLDLKEQSVKVSNSKTNFFRPEFRLKFPHVVIFLLPWVADAVKWQYRIGPGLQFRYKVDISQALVQASFRTVHLVLTENKTICSSALMTSAILFYVSFISQLDITYVPA